MEVVREANEAIAKTRARMIPSQDRNKSYAKPKRRHVEFQVGDHVFLHVSPMKGIKNFGKKGNLSHRFVGPFMISEKIRQVAYRLAMPPALSGVHNVFQVSILHNYVFDPSRILRYETLNGQEDLSYEEKPMKILEKKERVL
ncbi:uncharacterized protein LOC133779037 [Humulus lupulus]|uniref:uncharacterized protein LOC133779037 n=1 Tax=Humulus lupulus TaxID=3486 RepID=UPI002B40DB6B|nr:uncharacterized protein LOC133779037 [Humulus lupulus]